MRRPDIPRGQRFRQRRGQMQAVVHVYAHHHRDGVRVRRAVMVHVKSADAQRSGQCLQPRGDVNRVADHRKFHPAGGSDVADHDRAEIDADADLHKIAATHPAIPSHRFKDRPGDLAQAFMDLGAGICIPKAPRCTLCPLNADCEAYHRNFQIELPRKIKKAARPQKYGQVYWLKNKNGEVLFHKRPAKGLLGGMVGLPTSAWEEKGHTGKKSTYSQNNTTELKTRVHHTFTHFDLTLSLHMANVAEDIQCFPQDGHYWSQPGVEQNKLPSLFKKAFKAFHKF